MYIRAHQGTEVYRRVATNAEIAEQFQELAARMYLGGEPWFKVRAYQRAAVTYRESPGEVARLAEEGRLRELPGVGKEIALKTEAYLATGHIPLLDRMRALQPDITDTTQASLELGTPRTGKSQPVSHQPRP
jgi:DNA polymerase (family 10)